MALWSKAKRCINSLYMDLQKLRSKQMKLQFMSESLQWQIEVTKGRRQGVPDARARTVKTPRADCHSLSSGDEHGPLTSGSKMWATWHARHWNTVGRQVLRSQTVNRLESQESQESGLVKSADLVCFRGERNPYDQPTNIPWTKFDQLHSSLSNDDTNAEIAFVKNGFLTKL